MPETNNFKSHDRLIYIGFLVLIAWLPLPLGSNRPWAWAVMEVWVYVLAILWLLAFLFHKVRITGTFKSAKAVIVLLFLWLIWILIQITPLPVSWVAILSPMEASHYEIIPAAATDLVTLSVDPHATKAGFLKSLAYVLIFCLTLLLIRRRRRVRQLAYVLIFSALYQAVYGSLISLSGVEYAFFVDDVGTFDLATGTFVNRNHFAGYLVMCLSVGIGIMISSLDTGSGYTWKQHLRNILRLTLSAKLRLRLYLVIMVIALVLTHSRMGNTAFFSSLIIAGGLGLILSHHATRSTIILLTSLIIIDILIVGTWFGVEKVVKRIEETRLVTETRDEVDIYAIEQWTDYKWKGSGLGSFYTVFPKYRKQDVAGYYDHAHNDYFEFGTETGIIGLTLLGLVVLLSLSVSIFAQYKRKDPLMRGLSFASIMGITAILIHSTVDFNLQIPSNAATFMLLLAFAWISYSLRIHSHKSHLTLDA